MLYKIIPHKTKPLNLPFCGNSEGCLVWICCSSVTSLVVLEKSSAVQSHGAM